MEFNTGGTADSSNSGAMTGGTMASSMYKNGGGVGRFKVGVFNEQQLRNKEDKKAVEKAQRETGLKYVDTKMIKKGGKMYLEVYLIPNEEYYESSKFANGGGLKPIPKGNKGLPKLPKSVRNKMGYMAKGGGVKANEHFRLKGVEFLKDDLEKLEQAIKDNNNEEIQRFFSYWGQHLNMLENKNNKRMYNFLEDDLAKLEKSIQQNNQEEIDKFFSYWSYHISSLKMAKGGGVGGFELGYQKDSKMMGGNGVSGTIRTIPQMYYVATIDENGNINFEDLESNTKNIDKKKVSSLWKNNKIKDITPKRYRDIRDSYSKGGKMEWGGTAESSETGEFIGGENQSSMFENGGVSTGFTYDIGGL